MILQDQSPQRVMEVRSKLYELLTHCIPPTVILKVSGARSTPAICNRGTNATTYSDYHGPDRLPSRRESQSGHRALGCTLRECCTGNTGINLMTKTVCFIRRYA